jgi:hypothetical protein
MSTLNDIFQKLDLPPLDIEPVKEEVLPPVPVPAVIESDQNHDRLSRLVDTSLSTLEDILAQPTPPLTHNNYMKMLTVKKDAAVSVITASLKADENRFRKRKNDVLAQLLHEVQKDKGLRVINP